MFKNVLLISVRNLVKDKVYSFLNIVGFTIGISCSLLLLLYIMDELSYDRYNKNAENIYRIVSNVKEPDNAFTWATTQLPLAKELKDNYPEVINAIKFIPINPGIFKNGEKQFLEDKFYLTDSTVAEVFDYEFIAGDPSTALDNPFSLVLTESASKKYFSSPTEAFGQSLQNLQGEEFKLTAIIKDIPNNSHFRFDGLISENTRPQLQGGWGGFGIFTYILLPEGYQKNKLQPSLDKIVAEKVNPVFERYGVKVNYELQKITDIHLYSKIADEAEAGGDISYVYIFASVAIFMIIIASINYMNLATAKSINRAKEVGIRKVMGSKRSYLILQFITESMFVAVCALLLSFLTIYIAIPYFNILADKTISFTDLFDQYVIVGLVFIIFFIGFASGSYPAFFLSSFNPVQVLKGKLSSKGGSLKFRRGLVITQFALSIFMLISTLIVFDQLQFLRTKDLGFDKEHLIRVDLSGREQISKAPVFIESLKTRPEITGAALAGASPGEGIDKNLFQVEDGEGKMVERGVDLYSVGYDFIQTMGMEIVTGRDFSRDIPGDTIYGAIVNESMVSRMGWKDPIGKRFLTGQQNQFELRVVGVMKDYHQNSLYDPIEPLLIFLNGQNNYVFVRTNENKPAELISAIESAWKEVYPQSTLDYKFLNQDLDSQYKADQKRSQIFTIFACLTIFIACLGLLGLSAFTLEQRTKEIGVRKVIGASVTSLVILISKEFVVLVGVAILIAFPVAWYFTSNWLQNFCYRIELKNEWVTFLLSVLLTLVITFVTVGFHIGRAATANPVKSLRDE